MPVRALSIVLLLGTASAQTPWFTVAYSGPPPPQAASPSFSPTAGAVPGGTNLTLACAESSPTIRYTTDGSTATGASTVYSAPFALSPPETVHAICQASGKSDSADVSAAYTLAVAGTPTFTPGAGAVTSGTTVSISTTATGCSGYIYNNFTGSPTTSDTHSASASITAAETLYAKVIGCPNYADSAVGSAAYTLAQSITRTDVAPVVAASSSTTTITTGTISLATGDLLLICAYGAQNGALPAVAWHTSTPANATALAMVTSSGQGDWCPVALWAAKATGTASGTVDSVVTGTYNMHALKPRIIHNAHTSGTAAQAFSSATVASGGGTTPLAQSVVATASGSLIGFCGCNYGGGASGSSTILSGNTANWDYNETTNENRYEEIEVNALTSGSGAVSVGTSAPNATYHWYGIGFEVLQGP